MPIMDQRRLAFDINALYEVLTFSPQAALKVGLPHNKPIDIQLDRSARTANFDFSGTIVPLGPEKLGALLISYCIRAGISIPRKGRRNVLIENTAVELVFILDYSAAPLPKIQAPAQMPTTNTMSW